MTLVAAVSSTNERVVEILEAACRVVVREGAHGLRMAAVAQEAGVSKALVHYYFANRRELLRNAFSWADERWDTALDAELAHAGTGAAQLERALLMSVDPQAPFGDHRALWNEVWSSLRFDDELRPLVDSSYRVWLKRLAGLVDEGRRDGSIPAAVESTPAAWRLAAIGDGIDSMLYLGLLRPQKARALIRAGIRRELSA
ncbi:MAG TPA: TetR family transcriptional regulator [Gaiellaceae bacterium]|nr:TetR family transcriptional regulator [Gaiellaceae bacterium]